MNKEDPRYAKLQSLLKEMRKNQGVTQVELAERLGKPQSYVSKYELGERNIDLVELVDVMAALDLDSLKTVTGLIQQISK